ncbi:MAG: PIN domain-containing protein [Thermoanaerobaculia bacterium]|nr:PIN domain-containing protein [Thermoanaerobaculia bacterium]
MSNFTAIYDACVLYPASLRDLLIRLTFTKLFRARWTERIEEEWIEALLEKRSDLSRERLEITRMRMRDAVPDCLITGYEPLTEVVDLPDPTDRHVLAAAIRAQAGAIVTFNLRDFPESSLRPHGIEAQHPDVFVQHLIHIDRALVCGTVREQRLSLKNPPYSREALLDRFRGSGLALTVAELEPMKALL